MRAGFLWLVTLVFLPPSLASAGDSENQIKVALSKWSVVSDERLLASPEQLIKEHHFARLFAFAECGIDFTTADSTPVSPVGIFSNYSKAYSGNTVLLLPSDIEVERLAANDMAWSCHAVCKMTSEDLSQPVIKLSLFCVGSFSEAGADLVYVALKSGNAEFRVRNGERHIFEKRSEYRRRSVSRGVHKEKE